MRIPSISRLAAPAALFLALSCAGARLGAETVWWWEDGRLRFPPPPGDGWPPGSQKPIYVPGGVESLPGEDGRFSNPGGAPGLPNGNPPGYGAPPVGEGPPQPGQGMPPAPQPQPQPEPPTSGGGWLPPFFFKIVKLGGGIVGGIWLFLDGTPLGDAEYHPDPGDEIIGADDHGGLGGYWGDDEDPPMPPPAMPKSDG